MRMFSGLKVFVFLSVTFFLTGGTANAQVAALAANSTMDNGDVYVGDEVTVTFFAQPVGEASLYITAENIEVIFIQGAGEHLDPILPSNYTTSSRGELVVTGVFTGAGDAFIHAYWDRPHPSDDLMARVGFEARVPLPPATLEIVSGNHQHGYSGTSLQPFVVVVKDRNGKTLPGIDVAFRHVTTGGGQVTSVRPWTDRFGRAETTLTLGYEPGIYQVEASVDGYPSLRQTFTAAATGVACEVPPEPSPIPTTLSIVSGYGQEGLSGQSLASPFVVEVRDQYGDPFSGAPVSFSVIRGSGSVWSPTLQTNSIGRVQTTLTLGSSLGVNVVEVTLPGIVSSPKVIFTATALVPPPPEPEPVVEEPSTERSADHPPVYWIENGAIYKFTGDQKELLVARENGWTATSLTVDMTGNKIYWTERENGQQKGRIRSASLSGRNVTTLKELNAVPNGIITDPMTRKLYWTSSRGKIQRINFNGAGFEGNFIANLGSPKHIALAEEGNVVAGEIYWTAYNKGDDSWSIWSAPLDGSIQTKELVDLGALGALKGLAVAGDKLYWAEETVNGQGRIRSASRTGSSVKTLHVLEGSIPSGIAVDAGESRLYWTSSNGEGSTGSIQRLNLDSPIDIVVGGLGNPTGIALGAVLIEAAPVRPAAPSTIVARSEQNVLLANYPNPFNPETWIPYQLSQFADVTVSIYSVNGQLIRTLVLGHQAAGIYQSKSRAAYWDGRNNVGERVASGLYFYTLTAGEFTATRKMLIRK